MKQLLCAFSLERRFEDQEVARNSSLTSPGRQFKEFRLDGCG